MDDCSTWLKQHLCRRASAASALNVKTEVGVSIITLAKMQFSTKPQVKLRLMAMSFLQSQSTPGFTLTKQILMQNCIYINLSTLHYSTYNSKRAQQCTGSCSAEHESSVLSHFRSVSGPSCCVQFISKLVLMTVSEHSLPGRPS